MLFIVRHLSDNIYGYLRWILATPIIILLIPTHLLHQYFSTWFILIGFDFHIYDYEITFNLGHRDTLILARTEIVHLGMIKNWWSFWPVISLKRKYVINSDPKRRILLNPYLGPMKKEIRSCRGSRFRTQSWGRYNIYLCRFLFLGLTRKINRNYKYVVDDFGQP